LWALCGLRERPLQYDDLQRVGGRLLRANLSVLVAGEGLASLPELARLDPPADHDDPGVGNAAADAAESGADSVVGGEAGGDDGALVVINID
jgi:hypothetical protein